VAVRHIQPQAPAVLVDSERRVAAATQPAGDLGQALQRTGAGVGSFVQALQAGGFQQRISQRSLPALGAATGELRHQGVAVTVHHQAGQPIGFAMHQSHTVAGQVPVGTQLHGALHQRCQEGRVDALGLLETPHPHAYARLR